MQPEHGSETAAQQQLMPRESNLTKRKQSPRDEAVRVAQAKISRRESLGKQRRAQRRPVLDRM